MRAELIKEFNWRISFYQWRGNYYLIEKIASNNLSLVKFFLYNSNEYGNKYNRIIAGGLGGWWMTEDDIINDLLEVL